MNKRIMYLVACRGGVAVIRGLGVNHVNPTLQVVRNFAPPSRRPDADIGLKIEAISIVTASKTDVFWKNGY
jgi:hypothetical protein